MKRLPQRFIVYIRISLVAVVALACGGRGMNTSTPSPVQTVPTAPALVDGEPDWSAVVGYFGAVGNAAFVSELQSSQPSSLGRTSPLSFSPLALKIPLGSILRWSSNYYCCDGPNEGLSFVDIDGRVDLAVINGKLSLQETFSWQTHRGVFSGPGSYTVDLPTDGLRLVADVQTTNGTIDARQEYRLVGTVK